MAPSRTVRSRPSWFAIRLSRTGDTVSGARSQIISFLMLLVGIWLLVGAWILGYPFTDAAVDAHRNETGVGIVVVLTAIARLVRPRGKISDLIVLVLGVWLVVALLTINYGGTSTPPNARTNEIVVGVLLVVLASVSLFLLSRSRRARPEGGR